MPLAVLSRFYWARGVQGSGFKVPSSSQAIARSEFETRNFELGTRTPPQATAVCFWTESSGLECGRRNDDRYCARARAQAGFILSDGVFQTRLCKYASVSPSARRARFCCEVNESGPS